MHKEKQGPRNILLVSHSGDLSGAGSVLFNIVQGIDRKKFIPEILLPGDGPLTIRCKDLNIRTFNCSLTRWVASYKRLRHFRFIFNFSGFPVRLWKLVWLIKREKIDLVHTNTITVIDGAIAARLCGIPHIWHIHEILPDTLNLTTYFPLRFIYFLVFKLSHTVVTVSHAAKKSIMDIFPVSNIKVIHNGIQLQHVARNEQYETKFSQEFNLPENAITAAIIGSVLPIKGHEDLIEALCKVKDRSGDIHLFIIGKPMDQKYVQRLKIRINDSGLSSRVHFLGHREDVQQILQAIDIVVIPSWVESFSLVALEAMMYTKPIIATRSGGIEEIVEDEVSGFLVNKRDVNAIAERLLILASDERKRLLMGQQGRKRLEEYFSLPMFIHNMEKVYLST